MKNRRRRAVARSNKDDYLHNLKIQHAILRPIHISGLPYRIVKALNKSGIDLVGDLYHRLALCSACGQKLIFEADEYQAQLRALQEIDGIGEVYARTIILMIKEEFGEIGPPLNDATLKRLAAHALSGIAMYPYQK